MHVLPRRELLKLLTGLSVAPALLAYSRRVVADSWDRAKLIRAQIKTPVIPAIDFSITDFQAVGDGQTDCSVAIADAIAAASAAGDT